MIDANPIQIDPKDSIFNLKVISFYIFSRKNINQNHTQLKFNAVRAAKAKPARLQSVQEGDAQVLFQARFNEAHGRASNAGAVFERIGKA